MHGIENFFRRIGKRSLNPRKPEKIRIQGPLFRKVDFCKKHEEIIKKSLKQIVKTSIAHDNKDNLVSFMRAFGRR